MELRSIGVSFTMASFSNAGFSSATAKLLFSIVLLLSILFNLQDLKNVEGYD